MSIVVRCPDEMSIESANALGRFFDNYVQPNLPSVEGVSAFHDELFEYLSNAPSLFIVRNFDGLTKGKEFPVSASGSTYICSDNEAAIWFWTKADTWGGGSPLKLRELLKARNFPIAHPRNKPEATAAGATWPLFDIGDKDRPVRGEGLWKHSHVLDAAKDMNGTDADSMKARMMRLLHPLNHFLFPSRKKGFVFVSDYSRKDLAEEPTIQGWFQRRLASHYGEKMFREFASVAKPSSLPTADIRFSFVRATYNGLPIKRVAAARATSSTEIAAQLTDLREAERLDNFDWQQIEWNQFLARSTWNRIPVIYLNREGNYENDFRGGDDAITWVASKQAAGYFRNSEVRHQGRRVVLVSLKEAQGTVPVLLGAYVGEEDAARDLVFELRRISICDEELARPRGSPSGCYISRESLISEART